MVDVDKSYPDTYLPLPDVRRYSSNYTSNLLRTNLETGFAKQRRIGTDYPDVFSCSMGFDIAQLGVFEYFVDVELIGGQKWFKMMHMDGSGFTEGVFRIVPSGSDLYSKKYVSNDYVEVTFTTERRVRELITPAQYHYRVDGVVPDSINMPAEFTLILASLDELNGYTSKNFTLPPINNFTLPPGHANIKIKPLWLGNVTLYSVVAPDIMEAPTLTVLPVPTLLLNDSFQDFENIWYELSRDELPVDETFAILSAMNDSMEQMFGDIIVMGDVVGEHPYFDPEKEPDGYSPYRET